MNKIYDLATQAGLITFESIHDSMAVTPSIESVAKARKFAELIVKECADLFDKNETEVQIPEHRIHDSIMVHFGLY